MANFAFKQARTDNPDPVAAAEALVRGLDTTNPKLVVLFADSSYDQAALNAALCARLPPRTPIIGASTLKAFDSVGPMPGQAAVAAALEGDLEVGVGFGRNLSADPMGAGASALQEACDRLGVKPQDLDPRKHLAIVIDDGYRLKKEEMILGVLDVNASITLVGGGASHQTHPPNADPMVHAGSEVATDTVAIAVMRVETPWAALRHHAYSPTGRRLTITKVDPSARIALEIDGKPAAQRYAELADVPLDQFEARNTLVHLSTAIKVGREYFMRSPWMPLPDGSIMFANMLTENMELELMKLGDLEPALQRFLKDELPSRVANPKGMLFFNCANRVLLAAQQGIDARLSESYALGPPKVGFAACFELYNGFQINSTMTTLAFGASPKA
jgi:hypothetical protein